MLISTLELRWRRREGGGGKVERDHLDFIIDGQSLGDQIGGDLVSCLGWFVPEENNKAVHQLMLNAGTESVGSRYRLYVCAECGEMECGAITVQITRKNEHLIWSAFGYENGYDSVISPINDIADFSFERTQYRNALRTALQLN